jgi:hypothetical protein
MSGGGVGGGAAAAGAAHAESTAAGVVVTSGLRPTDAVQFPWATTGVVATRRRPGIRLVGSDRSRGNTWPG